VRDQRLTKRAVLKGVATTAVVGLTERSLAAEPSIAAVPAAATWMTLPTESYQGKQDDISFVDAQTGWYGNGAGKLYATTDGGDSWTKVWDQPGTFIRALGFVSPSLGFVGNVGTDYYPGVTDAHPLYRTRDGGRSFEKVQAPGIEAVKGICGISILNRRRIFQGELANTPIIHAAGRVGGPAMLMRSEDAGETWRVIDLSSHAGMILDVHFLDANTGFVCAANNADLEQAEAMILRTTDGGANWSVVYRGGRKLENCWKMSFPDARNGFATVQSYNENNPQRLIVRTRNGGRTWQEMRLTQDANAREFGIGFINARRGWVGTRERGYETRDGGRTWRASPTMGGAVNKIRVIPDGRGGGRLFAIGRGVARLDLT
jgi:photosystem II stability/assembly factor-like uncharacterized protein